MHISIFDIDSLVSNPSSFGDRLMIGDGDTTQCNFEKKQPLCDVFLCFPHFETEIQNIEQNSKSLKTDQIIIIIDLENELQVLYFCKFFKNHFSKAILELNAVPIKLNFLKMVMKKDSIYILPKCGVQIFPHIDGYHWKKLKTTNWNCSPKYMANYILNKFSTEDLLAYVFLMDDIIHDFLTNWTIDKTIEPQFKLSKQYVKSNYDNLNREDAIALCSKLSEYSYFLLRNFDTSCPDGFVGTFDVDTNEIIYIFS